MSDGSLLSGFFDGLDEFDGCAWEVRVSFPLPADPSALPKIAMFLEEYLAKIARATRACLLGKTGPTTWVVTVATEDLTRSVSTFDQCFRKLFDDTFAGTIDITPLHAVVRTTPRTAPFSLGRSS